MGKDRNVEQHCRSNLVFSKAHICLSWSWNNLTITLERWYEIIFMKIAFDFILLLYACRQAILRGGCWRVTSVSYGPIAIINFPLQCSSILQFFFFF